jgi:DNA replication protein DnaC
VLRLGAVVLPARLRRYASPDLVIIDEFGFDKIERIECPEAAHLLYKIIASRNQKRSTALVTNVDFDKWGDYLSDGPLAMAFLDRLVEGAIILKLKGGPIAPRRRRLRKTDPPKTPPAYMAEPLRPQFGHRETAMLALSSLT